MRWLRDIALLVLLCAVGAGVVWYQLEKREQDTRLERATAETQRLEREIRFRAATKSGELNSRGWPVTVDPGWFQTEAPRNLLVDDDLPWVEIAPASQAELLHPPVRMILDDTTPGFWYNPYQGVVRARVPVSVSDEQATAMYNRVNQTSIPSIQWAETPVMPPKPKADKAEADAGVKSEPVDASASKHERQTVVVRRSAAKH